MNYYLKNVFNTPEIKYLIHFHSRVYLYISVFHLNVIFQTRLQIFPIIIPLITVTKYGKSLKPTKLLIWIIWINVEMRGMIISAKVVIFAAVAAIAVECATPFAFEIPVLTNAKFSC